MRYLLRLNIETSHQEYFSMVTRSFQAIEEAMWLAEDAPTKETHRFAMLSIKEVEGGVELTGELIPRQIDSHSVLAGLLADSFEEFGKMPEGKDIPTNAATLWKAMNHGWARVGAMLRSYRES